MYVVAGRLDVFINSVKYELTKDDLMVINLNEVHSTQNLSMNNVIMGIPFVKYLNSLRLESAYKDWIYTDYSITYIEINNGFPDNKAFTKTFRDIYKVNPREYCKGFSNQCKNKLIV
ncbi:hypothetical protein bsdtw1_00091 [Clostridium fungisolvens]|uniref:HTH araC/xylS-type domain-containing protein n=1 Tax=Clostridium fungisolvens TaxID=1604897 RepID=A0A6V8SGP9_9CLOT|nr:hypothetical protein bsdtw1_00091 [Clostridium fungisolvens]